MHKIKEAHYQQQEKVNAYFQAQTSYWKDLYANGGVFAQIIRDRHAAVLAWIDSLALAPGSQVLEIGCGAGYMSVALVQRGLCVHAIDTIASMVEQTRQYAAASGISDLLSVEPGDAYSLAFEDRSFDLVIAVGLMGWLERPELAIGEMARVTKAGGHVIFTTANRAALGRLLDPWLNPAFQSLKRRTKEALERARLRSPSPSLTLHSRRFIYEALADTGLRTTRAMTVGFGPFTLFRHEVLPQSLALGLHKRMQLLADRGVPGLRSTGMSNVFLANKPAS